VTLIPKQRKFIGGSDIGVTQGHPAKTSVQPGHQLNVAPGLTDLQGNPINVDTTPGKVGVALTRQVGLFSIDL